MELNLGLPLVHLYWVVCHEEVLGLVAQRQSYHVLLLCILSCDLTPCTPQRQWWRCSMVLNVCCKAQGKQYYYFFVPAAWCKGHLPPNAVLHS